MAPGGLPTVFGVRPIDAVLGAEVLGVDLAQPLDDDLFAALYGAFLRHHLLVFRAQRFSDDQHVAFARRWGKIQRHVLNQYRHDGNPDILVLTNLDASGKPKGEHPDPGSAIWHTDGSWAQERGLSTMLYALAVPKAGGDTLFANMHAAYDGLSADMQARLAAPPVAHDIVRVHPDTGRKCLYLGQHASHIAGQPVEKGRALIAMLNAHCTQPQYTFTYRWSVGDAVIWDNRCLLHSATDFDWMTDVRIMRRTTTVGERIEIPA